MIGSESYQKLVLRWHKSFRISRKSVKRQTPCSTPINEKKGGQWAIYAWCIELWPAIKCTNDLGPPRNWISDCAHQHFQGFASEKNLCQALRESAKDARLVANAYMASGNISTLPQPLYNLDLSPADIFLFSLVDTAIKRHRREILAEVQVTGTRRTFQRTSRTLS